MVRSAAGSAGRRRLAAAVLTRIRCERPPGRSWLALTYAFAAVVSCRMSAPGGRPASRLISLVMCAWSA